MSKWLVTLEVNDPENLIENPEHAKRVLDGLIITKGCDIGENCEFESKIAVRAPDSSPIDPTAARKIPR